MIYELPGFSIVLIVITQGFFAHRIENIDICLHVGGIDDPQLVGNQTFLTGKFDYPVEDSGETFHPDPVAESGQCEMFGNPFTASSPKKCLNNML